MDETIIQRVEQLAKDMKEFQEKGFIGRLHSEHCEEYKKEKENS